MTSDLISRELSPCTPKGRGRRKRKISPRAKEVLRRMVDMAESNVPNSNLNFRSKLDEIFIPLSFPKGNEMGKALRISLLNVKTCRRHLLWFCLFKGVTVLEWFILEYLLESYLAQGSKESCACLVGVLSCSSGTRKGAVEWSTQLRPIHKSLKVPCNYGSGESKIDLLEFVNLQLDIPSKGMSKTGLYTVQEVFYTYRSPQVPSRIGVGYKDKGSLTPNHELKFEIEVGDEWTPSPLSVLRDSISLWRKISDSLPRPGESGATETH